MSLGLTLTIILPIEHEHNSLALHNHEDSMILSILFSSNIGQICGPSHCKESALFLCFRTKFTSYSNKCKYYACWECSESKKESLNCISIIEL